MSAEGDSKRELLSYIQPTTAWFARVYPGEGSEDCVYAGATEERVCAKVVEEFCAGPYWKKVMGDEPMPATACETVEKFFEKAAHHGLDYRIDELDL